MDAETLEREWGLITQLLPPDWRELARSTGAFRRGRAIRDPDTLLLLILLHVAAGLSLRQAAARAKRIGIAEVSDVGLLGRLRNAAPWLQALAALMFTASSYRRDVEDLPSGRRVRVVDATHVREPGSTGSNWRIHYVLQLPSLECDFFEITDPSGGETYKRLPIEPGDVILGDRGYAHREGVAYVLDAGGDVIVRINRTNFPLLDETGDPIDLLALMRSLSDHEPAEWSVRFKAHGQSYSARLCAVRKSAAATERSRSRILRMARKKQKQVQPETLEAAEYTMVLTTLRQVTSAQVLEFYRARWQVELAFKRMKSLFNAGHVPKYDLQSARAWLHAKFLAVLLIERLSEAARLFSPWGFRLHATEPMEGVHRSA